tara:strand:+ start:809 stop:1216 length:408 start_codon:yes stop_codon:yes gene_type:complete
MKKIEITVSDRDYDLLTRIAKADNRRLSDLNYLCYGRGLDYLFTDTQLCVEKVHADEYTATEQKQLEKNKELEKEEGFIDLPHKEKEAKGYKYVCTFTSTWEKNEDSGKMYDPLVEPLAKRIEGYATNDVKEEVA